MNEHIVVHDQRFRHLTLANAWLETLHTGMLWAEGPVYFPLGDYLLWSDIPNHRILQYSHGTGVRIYREQSNFSNGNTCDRKGRLITCEHLTRRVTRTEHDGSITVIADQYLGKKLNSPNDVVVKSDGTIWFTDPTYGIISDYEGKKADQEQEGCFVYCCDPKIGSLTVVADDFVKPNGLAFSPDESLLYLSDTGLSHDVSGPHHIRVFDVGSNPSLKKSREFAEISPGVPDGFRLDEQGNLWTSTGNGVHCYSPDGEKLGESLTGETVANGTVGGRKKNRLWSTATMAVD
ncbi:MAG: SMP-30/gluconolactonase/LRE family protein, partial [Rhizobiaceae bacterium]